MVFNANTYLNNLRTYIIHAAQQAIAAAGTLWGVHARRGGAVKLGAAQLVACLNDDQLLGRKLVRPYGDEAAGPKKRQFVVHSSCVDPHDQLAVDGVASLWRVQWFTPVKGSQLLKKASLDEASDAQQRLPLKEDA
jgi:hypothetical protein